MSDQTQVAAPEKRRGFTLPSAYTILFALIVAMAIATWLIPAGAYDLDKAGAPIPGTYHEVKGDPQRILIDSLTAPINGLYGIENAKGKISYYNNGVLFGAIDVALFVIVIGGFLGVTMRTGAIQAGIGSLVNRMRGRERWMIPLLMMVFALGGSTYGMAEESLAFYPLVIAVMIAAGYDALTGAAIVLLGCGIGTLGSTINPFATGIASGFAEIPISDGFLSRLIILVVALAVGILFVMRYADRVKKDPTTSLVHDMKAANEEHFSVQGQDDSVAMTGRQKTVLAVFGLAFVLMMYGVIPWEDMGVAIPTLWWWFPEMTALFILFSVIIGRRTHHRHRARHHRGHDQRWHHRHRAALGRAGGRRPGTRGVRDRRLPALPAAVLPHPVLLGAGHRDHADHGPARRLPQRRGEPRGHRFPERVGPDEPVHPHLRGGDGRTGHRPRPLRHLSTMGVAAAGRARDSDHRRARHRSRHRLEVPTSQRRHQ
jgi:hypothetical protein